MKQKAYSDVWQAVTALTEGEDDLISVMATVACELFHAFDGFNWVGFYRLVNERTLKVGPYQGSHGCLVIPIDRGVCGKCVREATVQLENDVTQLPFHIACSDKTRAELVVPIFDADGQVRAVLDIDSVQAGVFDQTDVEFMIKLCALVGERYS